MPRKRSFKFNGNIVPVGEIVRYENGLPVCVDRPIVPFIEGDGIGPEIWAATVRIIDRALDTAYGGTKQIVWYEIFAGGKAEKLFGDPLPADSIKAIRRFGIAIKGPLATPTGGGMRSINVRLRQIFDLYQCVRPVRYFDGVPSVVLKPQDLDVVIFRENTEDVYAGIEYKAGSKEARQVAATLKQFGVKMRRSTGIGIKVISRDASRRLVRAAIKYAIDNDRKVVTLVHKGNIQKYTEGAFRAWGIELAQREFGDRIVLEQDLWSEYGGVLPDGKILLNDRIADAMFFEVLAKPRTFSVIATTNLNGDYLSDACAAQVGGLGMAPGANIGSRCAIFEATHGTAPAIAGQNKANPSSLLLSAVMMLRHLGFAEAADLVVKALEVTIAARTVTIDLASAMPDSKMLSTSQFGDAVIANL
ncbi:MAG: NADP-dependent isocitrate dehydrogenase [Candidatus Obscuribacterales bacterium]|nr:NADP-dependent isocitrate dehydrogenase [Candidatus Obscuribacterales bacterium]